MKTHGILAMLLLAMDIPANAAERPEVDVRFELAQEAYREELTNVAALGEEVADFLVEKLGREVAFLRFSQGADAPFTVTFRLGDSENTGSLTDVFFHISLMPAKPGEGTDTLLFIAGAERDAAEEDFLANASTLSKRIRTTLEDVPFTDLVPKVFRVIPMETRDARLIRLAPAEAAAEEPVAWIIPYKQDELCMDFNSKVEVEARVPIPAAGPRKSSFTAVAKQPFDPEGPSEWEPLRHRLLCVPASGQDDFRHLVGSNPDDVEVVTLHVVEYYRVDQACEPIIALDDAFPTGDGS